MNNCFRNAVVLFCVAILGGGCSSESPIHPTYEQLVDHGFYAYVLPEAEASRRGWMPSPVFTIWSWDRHCTGGIEIGENWNPLHITYKDKSGQSQLLIDIEGRNPIWDDNLPVRKIELSTAWAKEGSAVAYRDEPFSPIKFEDRFGSKVKVSVQAGMTITETVHLINQLGYIGPSPDTVLSPWNPECCRRE